MKPREHEQFYYYYCHCYFPLFLYKLAESASTRRSCLLPSFSPLLFSHSLLPPLRSFFFHKREQINECLKKKLFAVIFPLPAGVNLRSLIQKKYFCLFFYFFVNCMNSSVSIMNFAATSSAGTNRKLFTRS